MGRGRRKSKAGEKDGANKFLIWNSGNQDRTAEDKIGASGKNAPNFPASRAEAQKRGENHQSKSGGSISASLRLCARRIDS
jgi:hypothetical protein